MPEVRASWRALQVAFLLILGGFIGYLIAWIPSTIAYAASYNSGIVIRIQTLGTVFFACLTATTCPNVAITAWTRSIVWLLGISLLLGSEWYFFGIGHHRRAVEKVYSAGGHLDYDWGGRVTSVSIGGRPYAGFEGSDLPLLSVFPQMTRLHLSWPEVGVPEADQIARWTQLESLSLQGEDINDDVVRRLRPLVNLRRLRLSPASITDDALPVLNAFERLESLDVGGAAITGDGVEKLHLPRLKMLDLSGTGVGDSAVAHLAEMASYKDLRLGMTKVTHQGINSLEAQTALETLGLAYSQISGPGFESIKNCRNLRSLNLNCTNAADEDLQWVAALTKLEDIQLKETGITDAGLKSCENLPKLRYILLNDTAVSQQAVEQFRDALPNCQVVKN
jgi:hypothetical protein